jgi:hypothetical protein
VKSEDVGPWSSGRLEVILGGRHGSAALAAQPWRRGRRKRPSLSLRSLSVFHNLGNTDLFIDLHTSRPALHLLHLLRSSNALQVHQLVPPAFSRWTPVCTTFVVNHIHFTFARVKAGRCHECVTCEERRGQKIGSQDFAGR